MRNHLIPTAVTDKNGKLTTVHKNVGKSATSSTALASVKPTLGGTVSTKKTAERKPVNIKWSAGDRYSSSTVYVTQNGFLKRSGIADAYISTGKFASDQSTKLSWEDAYEYLRLGFNLKEAALLETIKPREQWMRDEKFTAELPADNARRATKSGVRLLPQDKTIDLMKGEGVTPQKASKLLASGLCDDHLERSVLAPHEMFSLFERFTYQPSIDPDKDTNAAMTMDALNEGKLPFELAASTEADRSSMTAVLNELYPPTSKRRSARMIDHGLSAQEREEAIRNPEKISQLVFIASKYKSGRDRINDLSSAYRAMEKFGFEACLQHHPHLVSHKLASGEHVGREGALRVQEFKDELGRWMTDGPGSELGKVHVGALVSTAFLNNNGSVEIDSRDVAEMQEIGMANSQIIDILIKDRFDSGRALAVAQGKVRPAISEGWL